MGRALLDGHLSDRFLPGHPAPGVLVIQASAPCGTMGCTATQAPSPANTLRSSQGLPDSVVW